MSTRRIALEGARNFRDLGGYRTVDGRTVRWGMLYRSDALSGLTPRDLATSRELGIHWLCDFRTPAEREAKPDRLPAIDPPRVEHLPIDAIESRRGSVERCLREGVAVTDAEPARLRALLLGPPDA